MEKFIKQIVFLVQWFHSNSGEGKSYLSLFTLLLVTFGFQIYFSQT